MAVRLNLAVRGLFATPVAALEVPEAERINAALSAAIGLPPGLEAMGVTNSLVIYPGEGHGMRDPKHIEDFENRAVAWFDKYLK